MAFSAGQNGYVGRSRFRGSTTALSEINVVPLVDVVLVLLIIFMLTAHVMEFGLEVEVPRVREVRDTAEELPVVTIDRKGEVHLLETPVNINQLGAEIRRRFPRHKAVYLRGDRRAYYETVAQVVSALGQAELDVLLITQPVDQAERPRR